MYCIRCGNRVEEGVRACPVCAAPFTSEDAMDDFEEYTFFDFYDAAGLEWSMTPVAVLGNTAEVVAAKGVLEASGIPVEVRASNGMPQSMGVLVGGIQLMVPEPLAEYAKEILVCKEGDDMDGERMHLRDTELATAAKGVGLFTIIAGLIAIGIKALGARRAGASPT